MDKEKLSSLLYNKLNSNEFRLVLESINCNYPNLKQELFIRNEILESLNKEFSFSKEEQYKAFAEHPRGGKGSRIDLSIIDKNNLDNPLLIEFKFQYPDDLIKFNYSKTIEKDFQFQKHKTHLTDLFILFIACWDSKHKIEFDNVWQIDSNLSRYQVSDGKSIIWKDRLNKDFENFNKDGMLLETIEHRIEKPYVVNYYIYFLKRKIN